MNVPENHICQEKHAIQFPGSARRLNTDIYNGTIVEHQVTRNASPIQEQDGESRTARGRNKEVDGHQVTRNVSPIQDEDGKGRTARGRNKKVDGHQVTRNVSPIQDEDGKGRTARGRNKKVDGHQVTRNVSPMLEQDGESTTARGRNKKVDGYQVTRNVSPIQDENGESRKRFSTASGSNIFQSRYSPETSARDQCIGPKESTQVFNKGTLDIQHVGCEETWGAEVTIDECYFLDKRQLQFKYPNEQNVRKHLTERDSTEGLDYLGTNQYHMTPQEYTDEEDEYWRRDSKFRDVIIEESFLEQQISEAHQQWYRAREMRSEYFRSQAKKNPNFWLIICALFLTFITGVLVVIVWEYLFINVFQRTQSSNSSLPFMSRAESTPGYGGFFI